MIIIDHTLDKVDPDILMFLNDDDQIIASSTCRLNIDNEKLEISMCLFPIKDVVLWVSVTSCRQYV